MFIHNCLCFDNMIGNSFPKIYFHFQMTIFKSTFSFRIDIKGISFIQIIKYNDIFAGLRIIDLS